MEAILITPPADIHNEPLILNRMFKCGLKRLHLRKPGFNNHEFSEYLGCIDTLYHSRIVIHSCYELLDSYNLNGVHITGRSIKDKENLIDRCKKKSGLSVSMSCHSFKDLERAECDIDYVFLSPVFDSVSKKNYKAGFDFDDLSSVLFNTDIDVFALGGCRAENLKKVKELGFKGAAFLGAVWNTADPVGSLQTIISQLETMKTQKKEIFQNG